MIFLNFFWFPCKIIFSCTLQSSKLPISLLNRRIKNLDASLPCLNSFPINIKVIGIKYPAAQGFFISSFISSTSLSDSTSSASRHNTQLLLARETANCFWLPYPSNFLLYILHRNFLQMSIVLSVLP